MMFLKGRGYTIDDVPKGVAGTNGIEIRGQMSLRPTSEKGVDREDSLIIKKLLLLLKCNTKTSETVRTHD